MAESGSDRWRTSGRRVAAGRQLVARRQRVHVERLAVDLDAALLQCRLERLHEEERRIRDRGGSDQGRGSRRDPSADHQRGLPGRPPQADGGRPVRRGGHDLAAQAEAGSALAELHARRPARRGARRDDDLDHVPAVLQRAGRRRESPREVVPGTSASEARRLERAVVEGVVVADDPPGDAAYAEAPQFVGPADEGIPGAGRVERRIAGPAHHEIAPQRPVLDRRRGEQPRLEAVVPSQPLGDGGQRDDLHGRGRREQHVGIARVEALVPAQRPALHAPHRRADLARREQPVEAPGELRVAPPGRRLQRGDGIGGGVADLAGRRGCEAGIGATARAAQPAVATVVRRTPNSSVRVRIPPAPVYLSQRSRVHVGSTCDHWRSAPPFGRPNEACCSFFRLSLLVLPSRNRALSEEWRFLVRLEAQRPGGITGAGRHLLPDPYRAGFSREGYEARSIGVGIMLLPHARPSPSHAS